MFYPDDFYKSNKVCFTKECRLLILTIRSLLVGVTGFEPAASKSQTSRATNCATPRWDKKFLYTVPCFAKTILQCLKRMAIVLVYVMPSLQGTSCYQPNTQRQHILYLFFVKMSIYLRKIYNKVLSVWGDGTATRKINFVTVEEKCKNPLTDAQFCDIIPL